MSKIKSKTAPTLQDLRDALDAVIEHKGEDCVWTAYDGFIYLHDEADEFLVKPFAFLTTGRDN